MGKRGAYESEALTRLLLLVSQGHDYAQKLSKITGNEPSPIVMQLKALEANKYLKSKREQLLYKKTYSVNWNFIIKQFLRFALIETKKQYVENKYLKEYFQRLFKSYAKIKEPVTLQYLFQRTKGQDLETHLPLDPKFIARQKKLDKEWGTFLEIFYSFQATPQDRFDRIFWDVVEKLSGGKPK